MSYRGSVAGDLACWGVRYAAADDQTECKHMEHMRILCCIAAFLLVPSIYPKGKTIVLIVCRTRFFHAIPLTRAWVQLVRVGRSSHMYVSRAKGEQLKTGSETVHKLSPN